MSFLVTELRPDDREVQPLLTLRGRSVRVGMLVCSVVLLGFCFRSLVFGDVVLCAPLDGSCVQPWSGKF